MRNAILRRLLASTLSLGSVLAADAPKTHRDYRTEAAAAYERKDYTAAKEATLAALELRPDSPRYLYNLAALSALTNDEPTALDTLRQLAALGVVMPVERDKDFAKLQGTPEFLRVLRQFGENREPRGSVDVFAELPGRTGIIEGIAFRRATGDVFLSDVHHRCIWRLDRDRKITRFTAEDDELLGMFGIVVDEGRKSLWVAMTALPEMADYENEMKGYAALAEFNLATSEIRRVIPVPIDGREHGLGDLALGADGTVYASDSKSPIVWQLAPGAEELQKVVDSPLLASLQGMVVIDRTLLVADYANGLVAVEIATGNLTALTPPKNMTLLGLDGLIAVPGGVVATQNGVEPQRVLRIGLNAATDAVTDVTVLASGQPALTDIALVALIDDQPTLIAGSGWDGFDAAKTKQPPAHTVRLLQATLP